MDKQNTGEPPVAPPVENENVEAAEGSSVPPAPVQVDSGLMKAVCYDVNGNEEFCWREDFPKPVVEKGTDIVVKVHCSAVNPIDYKLLDIKPMAWKRRGTAVGFDYSGVIEAVGNEVEEFAVGDRVYGTTPGSQTEYVKVGAKNCTAMPDLMSFTQGAAFPLASLTAFQALDEHNVCDGQKVLIIGASGGIGQAAVQLAKAMGAHVTAVCGTANVELVSELGADVTIDYKTQDIGEVVEDESLDLVVDTVSPLVVDYQPQCQPKLKRDIPHSYVLFSPSSMFTAIRAGLSTRLGIDLQQRDIDFQLMRHVEQKPRLLQMNEYFNNNQLTVNVDQTFGFSMEESNRAYDVLKSRRARGKLVIMIVNENENNDELSNE